MVRTEAKALKIEFAEIPSGSIKMVKLLRISFANISR
jgi:hypothetical protein